MAMLFLLGFWLAVLAPVGVLWFVFRLVELDAGRETGKRGARGAC